MQLKVDSRILASSESKSYPVTRDDLPIGIGVFGRGRIALMAAVMLVMP
jgi:hypothetical protein